MTKASRTGNTDWPQRASGTSNVLLAVSWARCIDFFLPIFDFATMQRRSSQRTTPRKKYTNDAFDAVPELRQDISDDEPSPQSNGGSSEKDHDNFELDPEQLLRDETEEAVSGSDVSEEPLNAANDAGDLVGGDDKRSNLDNLHDSHKNKNIQRTLKFLKRRADPTRTYQRGAIDSILKSSSRDARRLHYYGPSAEDYDPAYRAALLWEHQPTLPSQRPDARGFGGFRHCLFISQEDLAKRAEESWSWYDHGHGRRNFAQKQVMEELESHEADQYTPERSLDDSSLLMGPSLLEVRRMGLAALEVCAAAPRVSAEAALFGALSRSDARTSLPAPSILYLGA